MADTKISALGAITALAPGDKIPVVDVSDTTQGAGGSTKYVTPEGTGSKLLSTDGSVAEGSLYAAGADGKAVAADTATAGTISAKTTLVDADQVLLFDSEASNGLKKVTATNLVANYLAAEFPAASDTVSGRVELATVAEADTGTDTARAVTPAGLAKRVKSDTTGISGADAITNIVSLTQAEYDAIGSKNASTLYVITA